MIKYLWLALAGFLLVPMNVFSKKNPPTKPKDDVLKTISETNSFALGRPTHIRIVPDATAVLFLRGGPTNRSASLYELDVASGKEKLLLSAEQLLGGTQETLSVEEKAARERKRISTAGFTAFELAQDGNKIVVQLSGKIYLFDRKSGFFGQIALPAGVLLDARLSPNGAYLSFVRDYDLYVAKLGTLKSAGAVVEVPSITQLTSGGTEMLQHGLAEFVAQEEMHRFTGYWWSPDGMAIAYQQTDNTPLDKFTIADASHPEKAAITFPYPRAGKNNAVVRLFVVGLDGKKRTEIVWDREGYPYLGRVLWQKSAPLSLLVQSRSQQSALFLSADTASGKTELLLREDDNAWLNLSSTLPRWLPDGRSFLFGSEKNGGWEVQRHQIEGAKRVDVVLDQSSGFSQLIQADPGRDTIFYLGGPNPTETHLYRASLSKTKPTVQLSPPGGEHEAQVSTDGSLMVLTRVTKDALARSTIHKVGDSFATLVGAVEIPSKAIEPTFRPNLELVPPDRAGGFNALVLRPHDFDKSKKYPVVLYVYGGPGYLIVRNSMGPYFIPQWIADHGFVVVALDGRGTPRRGRDHERALRGKFGAVPLEDQVKGLQALAKTFPELDMARVGVYGWSFGGYMAALSVLRRPDVFKVAVAGAPVVDWTYYDTHYTERYLGLPDQDREAYTSSSLLTYASTLDRPLMLVHGIADDNVYFAHTLQLADALFRAKKPYAFVPLVGLTHQVADPAVREALYTRIVDFLGEVLW
jgi:dipeptidyl-peptidase 4